jgi:hypothetical protein
MLSHPDFNDRVKSTQTGSMQRKLRPCALNLPCMLCHAPETQFLAEHAPGPLLGALQITLSGVLFASCWHVTRADSKLLPTFRAWRTLRPGRLPGRRASWRWCCWQAGRARGWAAPRPRAATTSACPRASRCSSCRPSAWAACRRWPPRPSTAPAPPCGAGRLWRIGLTLRIVQGVNVLSAPPA